MQSQMQINVIKNANSDLQIVNVIKNKSENLGGNPDDEVNVVK